jgi:hypothetical protein
MKNDREFLNGIYAKAEVLQRETDKTKKSNKVYYKFVSMAALIILIPTLLFLNNDFGYKEIHPMTRMISISDPGTYFYEADFIVIGKVKEVKNSKYVEEENYIFTDVVIIPDQVLKGDIKGNEIVLRINGGKVRSEKVYSNMESEFIKGKTSLLFLRKDNEGFYNLVNDKSQFLEIENNIFRDELGNKYSLEDIENNIKIGED